MKISGNEVRIGNMLEYKGNLWVVTKTEHVKPGKGGAFMQLEMKDIRHGTKLNERFRSDEKIERVRLEEAPYDLLFSEGDEITLMNPETFEQITLSTDILGDSAPFLQEGMQIMVCRHEEEIVSAKLPDTVTMEVVEADPVVKGQTATSSYKSAKLENGVKIMVPPFLEAGTKIVVNIQEFPAQYVERAK